MELRILSGVLDQMYAEANKYRVETGGILVGTDASTVTELIPSGVDAERSAVHYQLDPTHLQPILEQAEDRGLRFLGVWHVHPKGCNELSSTDHHTAARILNDADYGVSRLVLPLTTRTAQGLETRFFVAEGSQARIRSVNAVICSSKQTPVCPATPEQARTDQDRIGQDVVELRAAHWEASLRDLGDCRAIRLSREDDTFWLAFPPEYPLNPPDVFLEDGKRLRPVLHVDLPETLVWSSRRSLARVAEQAHESLRIEREAERLFGRRRRRWFRGVRLVLPRFHLRRVA